jgi:hypothetical protein
MISRSGEETGGDENDSERVIRCDFEACDNGERRSEYDDIYVVGGKC